MKVLIVLFIIFLSIAPGIFLGEIDYQSSKEKKDLKRGDE